MAGTTTYLKFGDINHYLLLGGGQLLLDLACELANGGYAVNVITSRRHAVSTVLFQTKSMELLEALSNNHIDYTVTADIATSEGIDALITERTIGISISAEWIFDQIFISRFNNRLVNIHGSRLPINRGGGGISWAIMQGDRLGGVTIHLVDSGIDTGDVIVSKEFTFPDTCKTPVDYQSVNNEYAALLLSEFVGSVQAGEKFNPKQQKHDSSTIWPRLNTEHHGFIDWNWKLDDIVRFINAFDTPFKGASTFIDGERVFIKSCYRSQDDGPFHPFQSGMIYRRSKIALFVATQDGGLVIREATDEQSRSVLGRLRQGHRFHTPRKALESALQYTAIYRPEGLSSQ